MSIKAIELKWQKEALGLGFIFNVTLAKRGFRKGPDASAPGSSRASSPTSPSAPSGGPPPSAGSFTGRFSKISGIREEIETVAWRDGGNPLRVRKGVGTFGGGVVTFERGVTGRVNELFGWFKDIRDFSKRLVEGASLTNTANERATAVLVSGQDPQPAKRAPIDVLGLPIADEDPFRGIAAIFDTATIYVGTCDGFAGTTVPVFFLDVVAKITLEKIWPVAYQISDLDAQASEVAIESLSLAFDTMKIEAP